MTIIFNKNKGSDKDKNDNKFLSKQEVIKEQDIVEELKKVGTKDTFEPVPIEKDEEEKVNEVSNLAQPIIEEVREGFKSIKEALENSNKEQQNIKVDLSKYTQVKELPSRFLPYPQDCSVFYMPYTYSDIKDLSNPNLSISDQYYVMLSGIHTIGFDKNDLSYFDFVYLGVLRRLATLRSNEFTAKYFCPKCGKVNDHKFSLADVGYKVLFAEYENARLPINIYLPSIKDTLSFSVLTVKAFTELNASGNLYRRRNDGTTSSISQTSQTSHMFDEEGNLIRDVVAIRASMCVNKPYKEAYDLISSITDAEEMTILEEMDDILDHGVAPLEFMCTTPIEDTKDLLHPSLAKKCDYPIELPLLGVETLIIPFRGEEKRDTPSISFGNEKHCVS